VKSILPSHVQAWISDLNERYGPSTIKTSFLVLQGVLGLAIADEAIKKNPARSSIIQVPQHSGEELIAWADERVHAVIHAHPDLFRLVPIIAASCDLRQGELFGLALKDVDFEEELIRVRRQIKKLGSDHVYALPKNDRERIVPLPQWAAEAIRLHVKAHPPVVWSLPWEKPMPGSHDQARKAIDDSMFQPRVISSRLGLDAAGSSL
jgi:integrase